MTHTGFQVGELIENRYRVLDVIGKGGMGTLYRVSDETQGNEIVALKMLRLRDTGERPEQVKHFQREFQLLTQLRHPNLVSVHDYGITPEGQLYFTMEWIEGRDLEPQGRRMDIETSVPIIVQVCRAVAYLHNRGVIHGDLKLANVLMSDDASGQVKIVDFGIALEMRSPEARAPYYSHGYSAPEMKEPRPIDHRADLYSLGAMWYALLVGEPPIFMFGAERMIQFSLNEVLEAREQISAALGAVIARLLATSPEGRYTSANEVIEAVNEIMGSAYGLETRETASSYALRTRFVNREAEIEVLQALWEQAKSDEGQLVLLSGESGVGKSRLLGELEVQAELEGARVVWGQCVESGGDAYHPWREVLRVLVRYVEGMDKGAMQQTGPVLAALLPKLWERDYMRELAPPADLKPQAARQRLNGAIVRVLQAAAGLRPTVIVIENAHWADEATLEMLRFLARIPVSRGLLVCIIYRSDEIATEHPLVSLTGEQVQRISLQTLSPEVTSDLVRSMLGLERLPDLLTERVQRTTGGNAFFVQELIRSLAVEGKVLRRTVESWQVDGDALQEAQLPESIRQVVERRMGQLSKDARRVLEWAGAVGLVFWEGAVAEMGQVTRTKVWAGLGELLEQGLVVVRDETSFAGERECLFRNPTVRQVSYESIPQDERRECHNRVATWLVARSDEQVEEHLGLIADHLERAGQAEQAVIYLKRAGEQAAAQFANAEAVGYFSRALDLTPIDDTPTGMAERYALLLAREKVYNLQGARGSQYRDLAALQDLAEALDDAHLQAGGSRRAEVALRLARYAQATSDYPAAIAAAQKVTRLAQAAQDVNLEAAGYLEWGEALRSQGDYDAARTQITQALNLARAAGVRQVEANSLNSLGLVSCRQGDYAGGRIYLEQVQRIYRELGDRQGESRILGNLGLISGEQGDYIGAGVYFKQILRICRETGERQVEAVSLVNLGLISRDLGDYAEARAYIEHTLRICRETGDRRLESGALSDLSLIFYHLGDDEAAREYSQQALLIAQDIGNRHYQGSALTSLGRALAGLERLVETTDAYRQALDIRRELSQHNLAMEPLAGLARVSLAQEDLAQAQARVEEILSHLENHTLDGTEEPFRIYLSCYRVLWANQDPRAEDILNTAHCLLQEWVAKIGDEEMRRSFLENVAAHREIVREFAKVDRLEET